jgi:deazaflavin-dependent oxidoreductase (nitroreductase family)
LDDLYKKIKEVPMSETPTVPPLVNRAMKLVLRSPLHGMVSKTILLITFTGRKSGKTYTTPVSYSQSGDQLTLFTHAGWWKNLPAGTTVSLRLRGRDLQGLTEPVVGDQQAIAAGLDAHLRQVPFDAKYYGVTFAEDHTPNPEEIARAAQNAVMIRIHLC